MRVTKLIKNTATIEYASEGWKGEAIGSTDSVHLNRLKVAIDRQPFPQQPPELVRFVELLLKREEVSASFTSFLKAWYPLPKSFTQLDFLLLCPSRSESQQDQSHDDAQYQQDDQDEQDKEDEQDMQEGQDEQGKQEEQDKQECQDELDNLSLDLFDLLDLVGKSGSNCNEDFALQESDSDAGKSVSSPEGKKSVTLNSTKTKATESDEKRIPRTWMSSTVLPNSLVSKRPKALL